MLHWVSHSLVPLQQKKTMTHKIEAQWKGDLTFEVNQPGGKLILDTDEKVGGNGKGLRPKPLMLSALAGCTGMDVASLMKKMRVDKSVSNFTIHVESSLTEEHPKKYQNVVVVYTFEGKDLDRKKLEKAVNLSIEKYCGVFEMFRSFTELTHEIIYKEN